jgi:hypothetical protein
MDSKDLRCFLGLDISGNRFVLNSSWLLYYIALRCSTNLRLNLALGRFRLVISTLSWPSENVFDLSQRKPDLYSIRFSSQSD